MSNVLETIKYKNQVIEILQDDEPCDPRENCNLGKMVCFHNNYNLGDEHDFENPNELKDYIKDNDVISLPLYLYEHSGITLSSTPFSCRWDSGQVGVIYVDYNTIKKEYGYKKLSESRIKFITSILIDEIQEYDDYLTGNSYAYNIPDLNDSCYGFSGDQGRVIAIEEAKDIIDYISA